MEKVRGGDIGLLSEPNSSSSLPPKGPGMGEFLMLLACTADILCTLSRLVEHLRPPDSKEQKRGLPPAQDCVPVPQTQHAMVYGAIVVRVASSVSMRRIHGALSALLLLLLLHQQLLQG